MSYLSKLNKNNSNGFNEKGLRVKGKAKVFPIFKIRAPVMTCKEMLIEDAPYLCVPFSVAPQDATYNYQHNQEHARCRHAPESDL